MKLAPLLLSFLCAAISISAQVNPQCPNVSVTGPMGMINPSELIPYSATVKPTESILTYKWTAIGGTIADGQGKSTIKVRVDDGASTLTVTVEIGGLSDECPNRASETVSDLTGNRPTPSKLDTFSLPLGSISDDRFKSIAALLNKDPTSQLYVLVPTNRAAWKPLIERLDRYTHSEFNPMRITFVEMNGTNNIVEVWLVPPGANPPSKCEACDESKSTKPDCPAISITGPAGITSPGKTMTFTTHEPIGLKGTYKWSVSKGGRIESGQGTPSIKVLTSTNLKISNITATVELSGLDATCPYTASETAFISQGNPLELDTYGRLSRNDEKERLAIAFNYIRGRSPLKAVVAIRVPRNSTTVTYASRRRTISTLFRKLRISKTRYVLVDAGKGELSTSIWIVPAESVPAIIRGIVQ
jgi:hypothetical protein